MCSTAAKYLARSLWCNHGTTCGLGKYEPVCSHIYLCVPDHVCFEVGGQHVPMLSVVQPLLPFLREGVKRSICGPQHGEGSMQGVTNQWQQLRVLSEIRWGTKKKPQAKTERAHVHTTSPQSSRSQVAHLQQLAINGVPKGLCHFCDILLQKEESKQLSLRGPPPGPGAAMQGRNQTVNNYSG